MNKKYIVLLIVSIIALFVINSLIMNTVKGPLNSQITQESPSIRKTPEIEIPQKLTVPSTIQNDVTSTGGGCMTITRKNFIIPGNDYEESLFFCDGKEIAKQKIVNGEILEQTGKIPDGKIQIIDPYHQSSGEEYYENGQKTGTTKLYFDNGSLMKEMIYKDGKLLKSKEYFNTGKLYIEQDFQDALNLPNEPEVGIGKIYYDDGTLRYEWNLTKALPKGYKRAYNSAGELIMQKTYDVFGTLTKEERFTPVESQEKEGQK